MTFKKPPYNRVKECCDRRYKYLSYGGREPAPTYVAARNTPRYTHIRPDDDTKDGTEGPEGVAEGLPGRHAPIPGMGRRPLFYKL